MKYESIVLAIGDHWRWMKPNLSNSQLFDLKSFRLVGVLRGRVGMTCKFEDALDNNPTDANQFFKWSERKDPVQHLVSLGTSP